MVMRQKTKKGKLIPGQGEEPSFPENYYFSRTVWHWILPSVSCKSRNLSLHIALRVELSEDSLPSLCVGTDAIRMSEVPLYSVTGNLTAYSVFQDCTKFSWICGLGKKKKKQLCCFNQSNQTKPRKLSEFMQGWSPDCWSWQGKLGGSVKAAPRWPLKGAVKSQVPCRQEHMHAEARETWAAPTVCSAHWDFAATVASAFHALRITCHQPHGTVRQNKCIGSLKCIKCHLLYRFNSVPSQTCNNCLYPLLLLPFPFYCRAGSSIHFLPGGVTQPGW